MRSDRKELRKIYKFTTYYDLLNSAKNYHEECEVLHGIVIKHGFQDGATLLDVGCGTGEHLKYLRTFYECEGVDLNDEFTRIAAEKLTMRIHQGNMLSVTLPRKFDVVICMFAAIAYVKTLENLRLAIANMVSNSNERALLIIEPWYSPDAFTTGHVSVLTVEDTTTKLARMQHWEKTDLISISNTHMLVADNISGVTYLSERHELGLFTHYEYLSAISAAGLTPIYSDVSPFRNGLYIGVRG